MHDEPGRNGHGWLWQYSVREARRRERAPRLLEALRAEIEAAQRYALPASALGKAVASALALWPKLVPFLDQAERKPGNHRAENAMWGVAVGRKNWIPVGSPQARPKVTGILRLVETCHRLGIHLHTHLLDVLPGLALAGIQKVAELTPTVWATRRAG